MTTNPSRRSQVLKNELQSTADAFIASTSDAAALLRYARSLEEEKNKFYQWKAKAIGKALNIIVGSNGKSPKSFQLLRDVASENGYSTAHLKRYSQLSELINSADSETRETLEKEQYWLDALRRKPSTKYLQFAVRIVKKSRAKGAPISPSAVRQLWDSNHAQFSPIIKPTDNWNFANVVYQPDLELGIGYIPGEIYANCFWYFVKDNDIVVDPMAGSGMVAKVYADRKRWLGEYSSNFKLLMYDLCPRNKKINQHNLLTRFPVKYADYIFIDPPYWGMSYNAYSDDSQDLANMSLKEYISALHTIARHCSQAQKSKGLCTVLMGNYTDVKKGTVLLLTEEVRKAWRQAGYVLYHVAYAARHMQKAQATGMAVLNNTAKRNKTPLTDMIEVLTFQRT